MKHYAIPFAAVLAACTATTGGVDSVSGAQPACTVTGVAVPGLAQADVCDGIREGMAGWPRAAGLSFAVEVKSATQAEISVSEADGELDLKRWVVAMDKSIDRALFAGFARRLVEDAEAGRI
ncbi:hypothetical protein [Qipengyuania zhejiangensis]|uniref:hypothetical protein n=1 Tax=Qipengyuania zhejiangensis TaxID=3077782 RepID=UPI002D7A3C62|nr:hypothetical protein [Qipengyuania sp. Z2]